MFFKSLTLAGVFVVAGIGAQADVIEDRTDAMDQIRVGAVTLVPMLKGDAEFDAIKAELALRMTYAGAMAFEGKFPVGSSSKGANPAIWENKADFDMKLQAFKENGKFAVSNLPKTLDELKAVYQPLLGNCAACHKPYRIKDK